MEIKFRAWDHVNNVMLFADFGELQDIGGEWTAWDLPPDSPTNTGTAFDVMQFTGLTDKNGVDIYVGDLIKNKSGRVAEVTFNKYCACFDCEVRVTKHSCNDLGFKCSMWAYAIEKIGNKLENPELMELEK